MADEITPDEGAVATEAPAAGTGPWQSDLEARFSDPEVRSQVDAFMRETAQPRMTQLEQRLAEIPDEAVQLYEDFTSNPSETYLDITRQFYGDDAADAVIAALNGGGEPDVPDEEPDEPIDDEPPAHRDPEVDAMLTEWQNTQRKAAYDSELARIKEEHPDVPHIDTHIHPFVASSGGDFDTAIAGYKEFLKDLPGGELPVVSADDVPDAPAVIGSDTLAPSTPPIQPSNQSLDAALDDFLDSTRASAPPTVGGV